MSVYKFITVLVEKSVSPGGSPDHFFIKNLDTLILQLVLKPGENLFQFFGHFLVKKNIFYFVTFELKAQGFVLWFVISQGNNWSSLKNQEKKFFLNLVYYKTFNNLNAALLDFNYLPSQANKVVKNQFFENFLWNLGVFDWFTRLKSVGS